MQTVLSKLLALSLSLFLLAVVAGCDMEAGRSCTVVGDCYQGETCHGGVCLSVVDSGTEATGDAGGDANGAQDVSSHEDVSQGSDADSPDAVLPAPDTDLPDMGQPDAGEADADEADAGPDVDDNTDDRLCRLGPFDNCTDDDEYEPNGSYDQFYQISSHATQQEDFGCTDWQDATTFRGVERLTLSAMTCPAGEDHFRISFDPCQDTLYVDIYFRVTTAACVDYMDDINFELRSNGATRCPARDDGVIQYYCYHEAEEADGWRRFRVLLPGKSVHHDPIATVNSQVRIYPRHGANTRFDYELALSVSR